MAVVIFLLTSEARISCSNLTRRSSGNLCFLNPRCVLLYPEVLSTSHVSLVLIIFSITLLAHDNRDIGLYDCGSVRSLSGLGIGMISELLHLVGISWVLQLLFIIPSSSLSLMSGRFLRNVLCISYDTDEDFYR